MLEAEVFDPDLVRGGGEGECDGAAGGLARDGEGDEDVGVGGQRDGGDHAGGGTGHGDGAGIGALRPESHAAELGQGGQGIAFEVDAGVGTVHAIDERAAGGLGDGAGAKGQGGDIGNGGGHDLDGGGQGHEGILAEAVALEGSGLDVDIADPRGSGDSLVVGRAFGAEAKADFLLGKAHLKRGGGVNQARVPSTVTRRVIGCGGLFTGPAKERLAASATGSVKSAAPVVITGKISNAPTVNV